MKGLLKLLGCIVVTSLLLAIFTAYDADGNAHTRVLGLPTVAVAQVGAVGWLALGQAAVGVLVIGQAGAGLVALTQVGASVFFGVGQLMVGFVAISQVGVGLFVYLGQGGLGLQAAGQGVYKRRGKDYFRELSAELNDLTAPPSIRGGA